QIIVQNLAAKALVEGPNFCFGRERGGDIRLLGTLCDEQGIELEIVEPLLMDGDYISSSRVRALIQSGDVSAAGQLLTRPYRLRGRVVVGERRGTKLGFPTANLAQEDT